MENTCNNGFSQLKSYLHRVFETCPDEKFITGPRSSALKFPVSIQLTEDNENILCQQTVTALETMDRFKTAHSKVEVYMLENDHDTISVETPIWLDPCEHPRFSNIFNEDGALSGHIDVLKILNNKIQILDYKPKAVKEKYATTQTYFYALMLSIRSGIPLDKFHCGYFDENNCYFFDPIDVAL